MLKKVLAVITLATAMAFSSGQSEAAECETILHNHFAFQWQNFSEKFSLDPHDKFTYLAQGIKYRCNRCGKKIVVYDDVNPSMDPRYATGCPSQENRQFFGDRHIYHFNGVVE